MTLHSVLVHLPLPLMAAAALLDAWSLGGRAEREAGQGEAWKHSRLAVGLALLAAGAAGFTGLSARRTLPAAVPGASMPWDIHVTWAVVLLIVVAGLGAVRLGVVGPQWTRIPRRALLLDLVLLALLATILVTGLRIS